MTALHKLVAGWLALCLMALALPSAAQDFPKLSGRVVDSAKLLDQGQRQAIEAKLAALETETSRQLVVATVADLQGHDIADYGYRLGRHWGIGDKSRNDGALLIVAPAERQVRIEVGYGLEPYLTDATSSWIIDEQIVPRFKAGDYPGGIAAGVDAIVRQLKLTPEEAQAQAARAAAREKDDKRNNALVGAIFWGFIILFFILSSVFGRKRGRAFRGGAAPVVLWGPLIGGLGKGGGSSWGGSSWGGGGFSGGGGGFGGGGASGRW